MRAADRFRSLPPRLLIGAVLSALLAGIGVNALVLQRERHPAPLFASPPQKIAASAPPAASTPSPPPAPAAVSPREPASAVAAPSPPPARTVASDSAVRRTPDAIGDLLRTEAPTVDASRLVTAAQTALAKLGYPVKADGARGAATDQALREFERAHGLPVTTEITPRLVKQLNSAARAAAR